MKRKNLIIDLTTLLDVILIILFMVLVSASNSTQEIKVKYEIENKELIEKVKDLELKKAPLKENELNWFKVYNQKIGKVELDFPKDKEKEPFKIVGSGGEVTVKPTTEDFEPWFIEEIKKLKEDVVIVSFKYNNESIYYRDYVSVRDLLINLSKKTDKKIIYEEFPQ